MTLTLIDHLDGQKLAELQNMLGHKVAGDPSSPAEGQLWYDSVSKTFQFRTDTASIDLGRLDQITPPTASVALNGQKITGLADGTAASDAATVGQVSAAAAGLDAKQSVRAATTANIATLAGGAPNTVDGVTLAANDRVLVKNQTTPAQNGIYTVQTLGTGANGTWVRATDMDAWAEVPNAFVFVEEGTTLADTSWLSTANQGGTLGTTGIPWTQFGAASSGATKESFTGPPSGGTTWAITHTRNTQDVLVAVYLVADGTERLCGIARTSTTVVTLTFNQTITANTLRAVIIG